MIDPRSGLRGRLWLAVISGLVAGMVSWFQLVEPLDRLIYDAANEASPLPAPNDILIVSVDERSLLEVGRWPWPRENHVQLLRVLSQAKAKAVAIDIIFAEPEVGFPETDQLLADIIDHSGNVILPVIIGQIRAPSAHFASQNAVIKPLSVLKESAAGVGHVHIEVDDDGVARSVFLKEGVGRADWEHFAVQLARYLDEPAMGADLPGIRAKAELSKADQEASHLIVRDYQNLIPYMGLAGTVPYVSYVDVIRGRVPREQLEGKIIFVGAQAAGLGDYITTSLGQISGVEINANIFHALRSGQLILPIGSLLQALLSSLVVALSVFFITRLEPLPLLLAMLLALLAIPLISTWLLFATQRWLPPAAMMITVAIAYPLWNWLRLKVSVSFMRSQLRQLNRENRYQAGELSFTRLVESLDFLFEINHLTAWQVSGDQADLSSRRGSLKRYVKPLDFDSTWQHAGDISTRLYELQDSQLRVVLQWQSERRALRDRLDRVLLEPASEQQQRLFGADVINENIARLDQAYQQAQSSRLLIQNTLDQQTSAVLLGGYDGSCLFANEQAKKLLDIDLLPSRLLPLLQSVVLPEQSWPKVVEQLFTGEGHFTSEASAVGGRVDLLCRGRLITAEQPLVVLVFTDVTTLKEAEKRRAEALSFLSHDLRAPLTSVLALIEGERSTRPGEKVDQLLDNIESYIKRNLSYSENFIQLAKLDTPEVKNEEACEIYSIVDNAIAQLYHMAKSRGIQFKTDALADEAWLYCDRNQVERALVNLMHNALKHGPDNCPIRIRVEVIENWVSIAVVDAGSGIPENELQSIFDRYRQGKLSVAGVGLGLHFVSRVAHVHQGEVDVESVLGEGSTFTLRFPLLDMSELEEGS